MQVNIEQRGNGYYLDTDLDNGSYMGLFVAPNEIGGWNVVHSKGLSATGAVVFVGKTAGSAMKRAFDMFDAANALPIPQPTTEHNLVAQDVWDFFHRSA